MVKKIKKPIKKTTKNKVVKKSKPKPKKVVKKPVKPRRPKGSGSKYPKRASRKKIVKKKVVKIKIVKKARPKPKKVVKKPIKKVKPKKAVKKTKPKKVVRKPKPKSKPKSKTKARPKKVAKKKVVRRPIRKPKKVVKRKLVKKRIKKKSAKKIIRKRKSKKLAKPRIYIGKGPLEQLFESQAKVKLLRFFFRNPEGIFQPKDVFKRLRSNTALLRQEMKKLEKLGLIKQKKAWLTFEKKRGGERKEQKMVSYLNTNFDFFDELRSLVLKSAVTSKDDLVDSAKKVGNIKLLVLAGVFTGDETARADLLIVGDRINSKKLNNFIKEVEAEVGKAVNCAVLTTKEFNYRYDMYDRFVRDLLDTNCEILIRKLDLW